MFFRIKLFVGAIALIATSATMAYDHGTKATAMQNIEDRTLPTQVVQSDAPMVMGYSKPTVWSTNHENDMRRRDADELRTQRTPASDVSFPRTSTNEGSTMRSEGSLSRRNNGGNKPSYYATHDE
jgi:hypothetical protein